MLQAKKSGLVSLSLRFVNRHGGVGLGGTLTHGSTTSHESVAILISCGIISIGSCRLANVRAVRVLLFLTATILTGQAEHNQE